MVKDNTWLKAKSKPYDIVSFDIFDTLLKRDVYSPTDVFRIVELLYMKEHPNVETGFYQKRREAEKKAREASQYDEITLDEIYDQTDYSDDIKTALKQLELDVEASVLHRNPDIYDCYKHCVESGKDIYIVSDMYLPLEFLEDILHREGITEYKRLFLSREYRATKRSGKLFNEMCSRESIDPKRIIHIGDSRYADYIGPRKVGIHSIHISRESKNTLYMTKPRQDDGVSYKSLFAFINSRAHGCDNRGEQLGYEVLGPIIYAYCYWLHKVVSNRNRSEKIWFAARDMYLFEDAYRRLFPKEDESYIYISRKSLRPMYAQALESIARSGDVFARGKYSLRDVVQYLGYSIEDADIDDNCDIEAKNYNIRKLDSYPEVVRALSSSVITKKEEELSIVGNKYLEEQGLFDQNIILADVGWHGTTQLLLREIQKKHSSSNAVFGMYLGCLDGTDEKIGADSYEAFLFNEHNDSAFKMGIILFESMILAPHGSTNRYELDNTRIAPVLSKSEETSPLILEIQKGAMLFISEFSKSILSKAIEMDNANASKAFERLTCEPRREEIESIGDLEYENFYCNRIASPQKLSYYLFHISDLKNDLKYSPWRIGFLYRLFKVRFPYAKLYSFARRRQGKQT